MAAVFGLTFFGIEDTDQAGVFSIIGAAFMGASFSAMMLLNVAIPPLLTVRPALYRELDAGFYSPESWAIATTLMEIPWLMGLITVFASILYFMIGLEPANFPAFLGAIFMLALALVMFGHMVAMGSGSQ